MMVVMFVVAALLRYLHCLINVAVHRGCPCVLSCAMSCLLLFDWVKASIDMSVNASQRCSARPHVLLLAACSPPLPTSCACISFLFIYLILHLLNVP